jgi:catechol 2,3-dioxygenase
MGVDGPDLGFVHLEVAELDRALRFYRDVLGFVVSGQDGRVVFLSTGTYHHELALACSPDAAVSVPVHGGHVGVRFPSRHALACTLRRAAEAGAEVHHIADHGAFEAAYLRDPDGHELALYWDRPPAEWPRTASGRCALIAIPLDWADLVGDEAGAAPPDAVR